MLLSITEEDEGEETIKLNEKQDLEKAIFCDFNEYNEHMKNCNI